MRIVKPVRKYPLLVAACVTSVMGAFVWFRPSFSEPVPYGPIAPKFFSTTINVSDLQRSAEFYTKVMGLTLIGRITSKPGVEEVLLSPNGEALNELLILSHAKDRKEPLISGNLGNSMAFVYADLNEFIHRFQAAGYTLTSGSGEAHPSPVIAKSVIIATAKDPDGYDLELLQFNE
jgi:catechol 2,3-dioxygenase-like lactoylglutathione lyase family enzyme